MTCSKTFGYVGDVQDASKIFIDWVGKTTIEENLHINLLFGSKLADGQLPHSEIGNILVGIMARFRPDSGLQRYQSVVIPILTMWVSHINISQYETVARQLGRSCIHQVRFI